MGYGGGVGPVQVLLLWLAASLCMALAGPYTMHPSEAHRRHERARLRAESILSAVSTGAAPSLPVTTTASPSRVYHVTDYGADPTGTTDSTDAIARAISDASRPPSDRSLFVGIANLDGAEIHLGGGTYLVSRPISIPPSAGNLKIHGGSLRASDSFPTDRYVIELRAPPLAIATSTYFYEYITLSGLMIDANYRAGGIAVVNSLRTLIESSYIVRFASKGIWVQDGHETIISRCFLGQQITAGGDPFERSFSGTAIRLAGNDNIVTDVVIFSASIGLLVSGQANTLTGIHCYNKATGLGGTGIYLKSPGLTQTRIVNCYLDYTGIVSEDPVHLFVSGSFFLGDANVVLKSVNGVIKGVSIVDNMFSGNGVGVDNVQLDETRGVFTAIDQVVVARNSVYGMTARSTVGRAAVEGKGTRWTVDFGPVLLFPNRIDHVQYTLMAGGSMFPNHLLRNVSKNQVLIESDSAVHATAYVEVNQFGGRAV